MFVKQTIHFLFLYVLKPVAASEPSSVIVSSYNPVETHGEEDAVCLHMAEYAEEPRAEYSEHPHGNCADNEGISCFSRPLEALWRVERHRPERHKHTMDSHKADRNTDNLRFACEYPCQRICEEEADDGYIVGKSDGLSQEEIESVIYSLLAACACASADECDNKCIVGDVRNLNERHKGVAHLVSGNHDCAHAGNEYLNDELAALEHKAFDTDRHADRVDDLKLGKIRLICSEIRQGKMIILA